MAESHAGALSNVENSYGRGISTLSRRCVAEKYTRLLLALLQSFILGLFIPDVYHLHVSTRSLSRYTGSPIPEFVVLVSGLHYVSFPFF